MPVITPQRIKEIKEALEAIHAIKDKNDVSAAAIKERWFPDGNITAAIGRYSDDMLAQLEIRYYLLTQD